MGRNLINCGINKQGREPCGLKASRDERSIGPCLCGEIVCFYWLIGCFFKCSYQIPKTMQLAEDRPRNQLGHC